MTTICLIIAIAVFVGYNLPIALKYGIQRSISATYNLFDDPWRKSLYSWFIVGIGIPLAIAFSKPIGIAAGILLCIDFAAPSCRRDKLQEFLHTFGANAGMGLGMVALIVYYHQWLPVFAFIIFTVASIRFKMKNHTYWIETLAFAIVVLGIIINKL